MTCLYYFDAGEAHKMEPAHTCSDDAPIQEGTLPAVAQADQPRTGRKVWGGVEGGAVLPTEQGQHEIFTHLHSLYHSLSSICWLLQET